MSRSRPPVEGGAVNVGEMLTRVAMWAPDTPAITWRGRTETYKQFDKRSDRLAAYLKEMGLKPGARVGLFMWNRPEILEAMFGCFKAGFCVVPLNARFAAADVAYHAADAGMSAIFVDVAHEAIAAEAAADAALVVIDDDFDPEVAHEPTRASVPEEVNGSALAWLFYTSGTTGRPKGAMLSHDALTFVTVSWLADLTPLTERDVTLHAAPLTHGAGFHALAAIARGAHQIITDSPQFSPESIIGALRDWRVTNTWLVPTQIVMLTDFIGDCPIDLPDLRYVVYGGAPFPRAGLERALATFGQVFVQLYAQGETPMTATMLRSDDHRSELLESAGRVRTGVELRIVDEAGVNVSPGEVGEIVLRGPSVMSGYWRREDDTRETLRNGWLHTGDLGHLDELGYLYVSDRLKDMIISGGSNIYASEVEQTLLRHPDVIDVAVVGAPDRLWGECVVAFIVSTAGKSLVSGVLDAYCKETLTAYKRPRSYHFVDALPRNAYGKVLKSELRQFVADMDSQRS
jgi:acyl-CoA synthetase (AMP-forming)/AMP-acid ligase II